MTVTAPATTPRTSRLDRTVAMRLAATEYERYADVLHHLAPEDWSRPTDCPTWDVRAMSAHCLGMAEMSASLIEQRRQLKAAKAAGGLFIDALTDLQVDKHAHRSGPEIAEKYAATGPRAAKARRRTPGFIRRRAMPEPQPVGGVEETWTIGFLVDVILTRDVWMHRVDTCRAIGRPMTLTAEHDGVLVADVVDEWARRHGRPFTLELDGPAGGRWSAGTGGEHIELDAVEFCRALSGRASGAGLLAMEVPF